MWFYSFSAYTIDSLVYLLYMSICLFSMAGWFSWQDLQSVHILFCFDSGVCACLCLFVPVWWFFYFYFILHSGNVEEQVIPKDCEKKEKTLEGEKKKKKR